MAGSVSNIKKIKTLRTEADRLANFHALYREKYSADSHCDKKGYGFGRDDRFTAFSVKTQFASWAGYYGSSSCGQILSIYDRELVEPYLIKAMNLHQEELFATAARLMREDAADLVLGAEAEIAALQALMNEAKSCLPHEDTASAKAGVQQDV